MTTSRAIGSCESCGKLSYTTKKIARQAARKLKGGHMNAYPCPVSEKLWHVGHLSKYVIDGNASRRDIYRRPE